MRKYQLKYRKIKKTLGTKRPGIGYETDFGYETSKPLGTNRPTWVRIDLSMKRPGYETSIILF